MARDRGQVSDGDVIPGETCEGTVSVGPCLGHGTGDVTERRWGEAEGVTTVIRARVCGALWAGTAGRPVEARMNEHLPQVSSTSAAGRGRGGAIKNVRKG